MARFYFKRYEVHRSIEMVEAASKEEAEGMFLAREGEELSLDYVGSLGDAGPDMKDGLIEEKDYDMFDIHRLERLAEEM